MWEPEAAATMVDQLVVRAKRHRIVFLQANPRISALLRHEAAEAALAQVGLDVAEPPQDGRIAVIDGFDRCLDELDPVRELGQRRDLYVSWLDQGLTGLCLLSSAPRMAYPPCPGSSVLDDAYVAHLGHLCGELYDTAWTEPELPDPDELTDRIRHLGLDALACLDFLLFDLRLDRDIPLDLVSAREWEALRGADLVALDYTRGTARFTVDPLLVAPVIEAAISESLGVQFAYETVTRGLVEIERRLRRALRARSRAAHGAGWRTQSLHGDLAGKVITRASQELARTATLKSLRDPLEYLSLGELLEVIAKAAWADHLGCDPDYWRRFAQDVVPIRNRVGHMRLLRRQDEERVAYWRMSLVKANL